MPNPQPYALEAAKGGFAKRFKPKQMAYPEFEDEFQRMMRQAEATAAAKRAPKAAPKAFDAAKKAAKRNDASGKAKEKDDSSGDDAPAPAGGGGVEGVSEGSGEGGKKATKGGGPGAFDMSKMSRLKSKKGGGGSSGNNLAAKGDAAAAAAAVVSPEKPVKKAKEKRVWSDTKGKVKDLDFSEGQPTESDAEVQKVDISAPSRVDVEDEESESEDEDDEEEESEEVVAATGVVKKKKKKKAGWLSAVLANSLVRNVVGKSALEREDLEPILEKLKTNFMNKNVAEEIAERLCESVAASLQGRKLASFSSLSSMVKSAMEEALTRILTPKRSIDILRDVRAAREVGARGDVENENETSAQFQLPHKTLNCFLSFQRIQREREQRLYLRSLLGSPEGLC